jgi:trans-L-3-hydroxyproline dehydratase
VIRLSAIDAHAAGEPLRLIVDGFPSPRGRTMTEKREWLKRHADHLRRMVILEPRGHTDMYGAILTEPVSPGSHAGVLFMHNAGYSAMCGHGIIAVTTIALERGLLMPGGDGVTVVFDAPAGTIRARATVTDAPAAPARAQAHEASETGSGAPRESQGRRVSSVAFTNVPSFVLCGGLVVKVGNRQLRVDVAFGGEFYAIVDGEAVGLPLDAAHLPELRRAGMDIMRAVEGVQDAVHPVDPKVNGVNGTIFTGPPRVEGADLRNVTVFADGAVDRSPCGTGTAAVMAVLDAMGLLSDRPFVQESVVDARLTGRLTGRTTVGEHEAIVTEISGSAWITGEHTFVIQPDDPLKNGFLI